MNNLFKVNIVELKAYHSIIPSDITFALFVIFFLTFSGRICFGNRNRNALVTILQF